MKRKTIIALQIASGVKVIIFFLSLDNTSTLNHKRVFNEKYVSKGCS